MSIQLSEHDFQLLRSAVCCVQLFDQHFAEQLWGTSRVATNRRLKRLVHRNLIRGRNVLASTPPPVQTPLCVWKPSEPRPQSGKISYQARKRWKELPVHIIRVYYATTLGRGLIGRGPISPPKDIQATHDLGVAAVFLAYRKRWPKLTANCWLNESEYASLRGRCVKVEDALLRRGNRVLQMIDYAGAYRPDRVEALLLHAQQHHVPIAIY